MSYSTIFRCFLIGSIAMRILAFLAVRFEDRYLSSELRDVEIDFGLFYGMLQELGILAPVWILFFLISFTLTVCLFFFVRWARTAVLIWTIATIPLGFMGAVTITVDFVSSLWCLYSMFGAIALTMAFSPPLADRFDRVDKARPPTRPKT